MSIVLSEEDIDAIARTIQSEVGHFRGIDLQQGIRNTFDVIANRMASGRFPSRAQDVVNQKGQFSAISGNKKSAGSWDKLPGARTSIANAVAAYAAERALGIAQDSTKGALHFGNSNVSVLNKVGASPRTKAAMAALRSNATAVLGNINSQNHHVYGVRTGYTPTSATKIEVTRDFIDLVAPPTPTPKNGINQANNPIRDALAEIQHVPGMPSPKPGVYSPSTVEMVGRAYSSIANGSMAGPSSRARVTGLGSPNATPSNVSGPIGRPNNGNRARALAAMEMAPAVSPSGYKTGLEGSPELASSKQGPSGSQGGYRTGLEGSPELASGRGGYVGSAGHRTGLEGSPEIGGFGGQNVAPAGYRTGIEGSPELASGKSVGVAPAGSRTGFEGSPEMASSKARGPDLSGYGSAIDLSGVDRAREVAVSAGKGISVGATPNSLAGAQGVSMSEYGLGTAPSRSSTSVSSANQEIADAAVAPAPSAPSGVQGVSFSAPTSAQSGVLSTNAMADLFGGISMKGLAPASALTHANLAAVPSSMATPALARRSTVNPAIAARAARAPTARPSSVRTVNNIAPSVNASIQSMGLPEAPNGASYGYSPFGDGVATVYDNAPDRVKGAATGPGLAGFLGEEDLDFMPSAKTVGRATFGALGNAAFGPVGGILGGILGGYLGSQFSSATPQTKGKPKNTPKSKFPGKLSGLLSPKNNGYASPAVSPRDATDGGSFGGYGGFRDSFDPGNYGGGYDSYGGGGVTSRGGRDLNGDGSFDASDVAAARERADREGGGGAGVGGVGCFLTTAAVEIAGESDDGNTLETLRWFRDNIMRRRPDWSADVDTYYQIAPQIVERMGDDKSAYRRLLADYIRPAVAAINRGDYDAAYRLYRAMVESLE